MDLAMAACKTYVDMLKHIEQGKANSKALNHCDSDGSWHSLSTQQFLEQVKYLALGLRQMGLRRGDRVGIFALSSPHWTIADIAIVLAGGITVPLFATIAEDNFIYEIGTTHLKMLFVDGVDQWALFRKHEESFDRVISLETEVSVDEKIRSFHALIDAGRILDQREPHLYAALQEAIAPETVTCIIFTSGSTGVPKGVELTQQNLIGEVDFEEYSWDAQHDRYLSVLPLEHVFGHCFNIWMLFHGVSIYYCHDHKHLAQVCSQVQPTMIAVVPRLLERVYAKMVEKIHHARGVKHFIAKWAFLLASKPTPSLWRKLLFPILDALVYAKLRQALGGKLRMMISGGAPLGLRLHSFFEVIGIPIYQGWGLTEACPLAANTPLYHKVGTVGRALPGQEIKIAPQGEILVRGSLVMRGYFNDPEKTAQTIDAEGYLHTGDKGKLDEEGFLTIIGRVKELYKSSTGEYIAPVPIEQALCASPLIDMAMVIAEGKPFASCLLFPNMETVARVKRGLKAEDQSDEAFLVSPYIKREMQKLVQEVNRHLNRPEQIREYRFILEPLTIAGGELTPSMKIRRDVIMQKYRALIDQIYQEKEREE